MLRLRKLPGPAAGAVIAAISALACSRFEAAAASEPFALTFVRPSIAEGVFLNEDLVFYFNEEIDPTSVSGASIEVRSEDGLPARGRLRVELDRVRFLPAPVTAPDLSDGGYLPGTRYTVTLAGFPRPEGLRSARGSVLQGTITWSFRTVQVSFPPTGLVFEDPTPDRAGFLRLFPAASGQGGLIGSLNSIYLACDKPLDPSSLREEAFLLRDLADPAGSVGVRLRVLENHLEAAPRPRPPTARSSAPSEAWERERRACLIELTPRRRPAAGVTWELRLEPGPDGRDALPRDFGGRPVIFDAPASAFRIEVTDPAADAGRGALQEEFDTRRFHSPIAVLGCDGTAYWRDSGRVEVRYPAAAGSGARGAAVLVADEVAGERDLQALSIDLPEGEACRLSPEPGLVVLRCQGRMSIRGKLSREAPWDAGAESQRDPTLLQWEDRERTRGEWQTLSDWLGEAREKDWNWTVLIAGGDLSIEGTLDSTTPLLLVAGGMLRVSGTVRGGAAAVSVPAGPNGERARSAQAVGGVYRLGQGGGYGIEPERSLTPLYVDEPHGLNPLAARLRFAVLSGPIPPRGEVLRWLPPEAGGWRPRSQGPPARSSWRVRFLPELASSSPAAQDLEPVDSPLMLDPPGPLQFLVELEIEPGGSWDPPWVDYLHLSWEQPPGRAGAAPPREPQGDR